MYSRRSFKRRNVKEGTFAVLFENSSKIGQILDISPGGFSFRYSDSKLIDNDRDGRALLFHDPSRSLKGLQTFDIFLVESGIYLNRIPCQIITNIDIDVEDKNHSIPMKRCGVKFFQLSSDQIINLSLFIEKCTTV